MNIFWDTTGEYVNAIVNDPAVKPGFMGGDERELDLSRLIADPRCRALVGEPPVGVHLGWRLLDGVWEFHSAALPSARGGWMTAFTYAVIRYMFCSTDCIELMTRIPQGQVSALALAKHFNFRERWVNPPIHYRGKDVPCTVYSLTLFDWLPSDPEGREAVFEDMRRASWGHKADNWEARWRMLSSAVLH
jgi:hypothetical protein